MGNISASGKFPSRGSNLNFSCISRPPICFVKFDNKNSAYIRVYTEFRLGCFVQLVFMCCMYVYLFTVLCH
ncbi:hypothetical protein LDENG_00187890 [Lucifuga dentata]|nr:hypothetical protein LDENG_00187890 [Lucifuga dentata]